MMLHCLVNFKRHRLLRFFALLGGERDESAAYYISRLCYKPSIHTKEVITVVAAQLYEVQNVRNSLWSYLIQETYRLAAK